MPFIRILIVILFLITSISTAFSNDIALLLSKANKLKYAEKYEVAEKLYDQILEADTQNKEALRGKADCRIMLEPIIPVQHLAIPAGYADPEYQELLQQFAGAKAPWDKRQLAIALDRYAVKYTGQVYSEDAGKKGKEAENIVNKAKKRIKSKKAAEPAYLETARELFQLQKEADRSWKGHGPEILGPALKKLDDSYAAEKLPNPSKPIILTLKIFPERPKEGEEVSITATLKNRSSFPVTLVDFQIEGQNYTLYTFEELKGEPLLPEQTISFNQNTYLPDLEPAISIRFYIIGFDDSQAHLWTQSISLASGLK
ncbi:hypothetical protein A3H38_03655 [candidate division WOR-1 bacterium RIFCSPLOWO2_02_FULL_46_20]|uniref:Uncharacterized protein n=2 Tax=Saganbacteria TaxID=1703751 RepID=A0A1F4R4G0_UNCSA|nr:MAG: hypothetical protein A3J44_00505 [candidate division WOR-1 bacterium RIFCSPHIGHO2_02_FULL_45_12]OGC03121.1 MAG: hypothetical protein A3H38_03655 [candidate division WOR-1 bacterium RIFCSPLOWO2_02_FULL_46_20]OGC08064.1 MAG: hypothetical protein A3F86_01640 [candidate division WOR-1 bacterium RIFCSPLOWO2_12_FULL_45_9]